MVDDLKEPEYLRRPLDLIYDLIAIALQVDDGDGDVGVGVVGEIRVVEESRDVGDAGVDEAFDASLGVVEGLDLGGAVVVAGGGHGAV